jgi:hypothetical protein
VAVPGADWIPIGVGSLVAIDTVIWIYEFETNPIFGRLAPDLFRNVPAMSHRIDFRVIGIAVSQRGDRYLTMVI